MLPRSQRRPSAVRLRALTSPPCPVSQGYPTVPAVPRRLPLVSDPSRGCATERAALCIPCRRGDDFASEGHIEKTGWPQGRIASKNISADQPRVCANVDERYVNDSHEVRRCHAHHRTDFRSCSANCHRTSHCPNDHRSRPVWPRRTSPSMHRPSCRARHLDCCLFLCSSSPPLNMLGATSDLR